jgi:hypothetical protein
MPSRRRRLPILGSWLAAALLVIAVAASGAFAAAGLKNRRAVGGHVHPVTEAPANGATVSGHIRWKVAVRGARPHRLDFVVDGAVEHRVARRRAVPRTRTAHLDTTKLSNGSHTLTAVAYTPSGRRSKSKVVITVDNPPPTTTTSPPPSGPVNGSGSIYWGAWIGNQLTGTESPWDMNAVSRFEGMAGKHLSTIHFAQPFANCSTSPCSFYGWPTTPMNSIRAHGSIPFLSWSSQSIPWASSEPDFQLSDVISGRYDSYIRSFATAAKNWGHPFFLRFNWEMNGGWFAWGERANGNQPGEYVAAWRHVHDIFTSVGATNASWVWCPNVDPDHKLTPLAGLYPGDAYVDWTCLDGYNWGTNPASPKGWKSFDQLFSSDYDLITGSIAPTKPMVIGEFGSSEYGGSKSAWIQNALARIPAYTKIRAVQYFEKYDDGMDWPIETSSTATAAFAAGIQNPAYLTNTYGGLATTGVQPPG